MKDQILNLNSHGKALYIGDDCSEETLEDILDLKEKLVYSFPHRNPWNPLVLSYRCITVPRSNCPSKGDHLTLLLLWLFFWLASTKCTSIWSVRLSFYWVNHSFLLCNGLPQRFEAFPHFFLTRVSFLLAQFRLQHKIFVKKPSLEISFQEHRLEIKTSFGFFCPPEVVNGGPPVGGSGDILSRKLLKFYVLWNTISTILRLNLVRNLLHLRLTVLFYILQVFDINCFNLGVWSTPSPPWTPLDLPQYP